eukprot:TRINITY_DN710_c0_g1_i2.p1 TRINITY_DN710_c0_g1~~TRINITY_DN710_c0_g1_i2.p1  ORF type:complete len:417 (+),score=88.19 TRINITY_DN710_c0_g1_i2:938-2188(+)
MFANYLDKKNSSNKKKYKKKKKYTVKSLNDKDLHENEMQEINDPEKSEEEEVLEKSFENLPEAVKQKCEFLGMTDDQELLDTNINILYTVARFVMRDEFKVLPRTKHKRVRPYISEELTDIAKNEIIDLPKPPKKIFKKQEFAGKGGFGSVLSSKLHLKGEEEHGNRIAIKKIPHDTERNRENNYSEIYFLMECKHKKIVRYCNTWQVKDEIWIITEFLEGGTLSDAARMHQFSDDHIAYVAKSVLKGLSFLHSKQFAHRDLKSQNVMMSIEGEIKIIDFGLCADFSEGPRTKMLGSPYWIPPEMIKGKPHSFPVDIWSLAVCLLELFLSAPPLSVSSLKCMFSAATIGLEHTIPDSASPEAADFLRKCLVIEPEDRETADELLKHPWVDRKELKEGIDIVLRKIFLTQQLEMIGF